MCDLSSTLTNYTTLNGLEQQTFIISVSEGNEFRGDSKGLQL